MIVYLPQMLGLRYARLFHRLTMLQEHGCLYKLARVMALTDAKFAQRFATWHCRKVSTGGIVRAAARDGEVSINRVAMITPSQIPLAAVQQIASLPLLAVPMPTPAWELSN